jgi:hypothetical protein
MIYETALIPERFLTNIARIRVFLSRLATMQGLITVEMTILSE